MKICISSQGKDLDSKTDQRFGRASFLGFYDTEKQAYESIENQGVYQANGAGISAATKVVEEGCKVLLTGHVGKNAFEVLQHSVEVYHLDGESVKEAIKSYERGDLHRIFEYSPSMKGQHRHGQGIGNNR
ncbi:NifB/NifX family molybdenum-iron cluster-binding protein [Vallitalea okinawensis]|uniref:NifB/NifX family molybdenum-iron cluster-binding protein n=1 Tax=Vallitalea okinawensis TaxID=2078660 RepID=UPI000CFB121D|nr:NifB/NifX family molybdenum-iron cluster-binding protein [Vallitalea okinawensis]